MTAAEALELGLVHEVVPNDQLLDSAVALAREFAEGPQVAIRLLKRSIYQAAELSMEQAFDDIATKAAITDHHADAKEGGTAFREKRAPAVSPSSPSVTRETGPPLPGPPHQLSIP